MKGSTFALSETFMKILTTAYVAIVLLGIYFALNQYHLIFVENRVDREALNIGNAILSSCIAEYSGGYPVKGLLSKEKIEEENERDPFREENIQCLRYDKGIYIEIYDTSKNILYRVGNFGVCDRHHAFPDCIKKDTTTTTTFPAALNITNKVIPVIVNVSIGVAE